MSTALEPCGVDRHAGLSLGSDELELVLTSTAVWVVRLVCRAFRDRCSGPIVASSCVESVARCELAIKLGGCMILICQSAAIRHERREVLEWLHAQVDAWTEWTCRMAARDDGYAYLRVARLSGCPWDADACLAAAAPHPYTLAWIHKHLECARLGVHGID